MNVRMKNPVIPLKIIIPEPKNCKYESPRNITNRAITDIMNLLMGQSLTSKFNLKSPNL